MRKSKKKGGKLELKGEDIVMGRLTQIRAGKTVKAKRIRFVNTKGGGD